VHTFDLVAATGTVPTTKKVDELFAALGVFDVSDTTRAVVEKQRDAGRRFALAVASPEYTVV
jgi:hypothetical protein